VCKITLLSLVCERAGVLTSAVATGEDEKVLFGSEMEVATGEGAAAGLGAEALNVLVGWVAEGGGTEAGTGVAGVADENDGTAVGGGPLSVDPLSRLTSLRGATLPLKNSEALREGSIEGAGGKMSDWNESACTGQISR
jgi:hypothetical protein